MEYPEIFTLANVQLSPFPKSQAAYFLFKQALSLMSFISFCEILEKNTIDLLYFTI